MTSTERNRRILQAIADTDRFITRESARAADIRPADMQRCLDQYISHKQRLVVMLAEG